MVVAGIVLAAIGLLYALGASVFARGLSGRRAGRFQQFERRWHQIAGVVLIVIGLAIALA